MGVGVGLTLVRSHLWRMSVSIVGHRVKRSFSRASVTMAFFDEIDCELDESFILHSEEGKYVWIIFFNFRASNRLPSDLRVRSTSDQIDSSPWRW